VQEFSLPEMEALPADARIEIVSTRKNPVSPATFIAPPEEVREKFRRIKPLQPKPCSWIRRVCLIFLHKNFVVRRLQIAVGYARSSLLVLRKNLRRSRILPNRMVTAKELSIIQCGWTLDVLNIVRRISDSRRRGHVPVVKECLILSGFCPGAGFISISWGSKYVVGSAIFD
jgi:hypothetical protein